MTPATAITRPLSTSAVFGAAKRTPSLSDLKPDTSHVFDQKQQAFREEVKRREEEDRKLYSLCIVIALLTPATKTRTTFAMRSTPRRLEEIVFPV